MKRLVVLGAAESGVGAAVLARKKGYDVFVSDKGKIKQKYKDVLLKFDIKWEEEMHTEALILNADEVVKSPGIPDKATLVVELMKKNISVISEIEFAGRFTKAFTICITGSNGKTTTTLLSYHILKNAGFNVGLAGNIGKSFAMQVALNDFDYYVIELSSFQLDGIYQFKPNIAILLNIAPDHLDRYNYDFQNYIDSKFKVTRNLTEADTFIFCLDDEITIRELTKKKIRAKTFPFSIKQMVESGAFLNENDLIININPNPLSMSIQELALQGKHNIYNSMAAGIAAKVVEIRKEVIRESLSDFQNIEHRLEFVAKVHGIEFINDSKATNVNSTWYALESIVNPVVWIVGGVDKGNDYDMLKELVKEKVKAIICLGLDNAKIIKTFSDVIETIVEVNSAKEAVRKGYYLSKNGDTVLLSPCCASFDLFENYEDRGNQFKQAVREL